MRLIDTDVVVIGGGVIGSAVALQLATDGSRVTIIRNKGEDNITASRAAGALLGVFSECSSQDSPEKLQIETSARLTARAMYETWISSICQDSGLSVSRTNGLFVVANADGDSDTEELSVIREAAQSWNRQVATVSPRDVPGLEPKRGSKALEALFLPDEGTVHTGELMNAIEKSLLRQEKVSLVNKTAVDIKTEKNQRVVQCSDGSVFLCHQVVLAGGAMMTELLATISRNSLEIPSIFAGRGVSLILKSKLNFPHCIRTPNRGFACGVHVVPRASQEIYLGATNRLTTAHERISEPIVSEVNNLLLGGINEINQNFGHAELISMSVGYRPVTVDGLPLVGRTAIPGVLIATGTYRNGILLAPLIAKLISEEIAEPGTHELHPFSPTRNFRSPIGIDLNNWARQVSIALTSSLMEPSGTLPYNHEQELQDYFYVTLKELLGDNQKGQSLLSAKIRRLLLKTPMKEAAPAIFQLIIRHKETHGKT